MKFLGTDSAVLWFILRYPARCKILLCGVLSSAETDIAVSCSLESLTLRCSAFHALCKIPNFPVHRRVVLCVTLLRLTLRCPFYQGVWLSGVLHTAESITYKFWLQQKESKSAASFYQQILISRRNRKGTHITHI